MKRRRWGHAGRGVAKVMLMKSCSSCSAVFKGLLKQLLQTHQQGKYGEAWYTEEGEG